MGSGGVEDPPHAGRYLDGVEVIPNMDSATQQAAFAAKQIDIQVFSDKAQLDAFLKSAPDAVVSSFTYASDASLIFNLERPYLDKLEVRQALNLIINRQEILDNALETDPDDDVLTTAIKTNVLVQLDHLRTYPAVAEAESAGELALHGCYYRFETGDVLAFDAAGGKFVSVRSKHPNEATVA